MPLISIFSRKHLKLVVTQKIWLTHRHFDNFKNNSHFTNCKNMNYGNESHKLLYPMLKCRIHFHPTPLSSKILFPVGVWLRSAECDAETDLYGLSALNCNAHSIQIEQLNRKKQQIRIPNNKTLNKEQP